MSRSYENVKKIIDEIEGSVEEQNVQTEKTMDEIVDIFLQNKSEINREKKDSDCIFDMEELRHWKEQMNQEYRSVYYREITSGRKHFRRIIVFVKRVIRKLCRFLIEPVIEEQNRFNADTTAAINTLYNNEVVTEASIAQQKEMVNQISDLSEWLRNSVKELENLNGKNEYLEREIEECRSDLQECRNELQESQKDLQECRSELQESQKDLQECRSELEDCKQKETELEHKCSEVEQKYAEREITTFEYIRQMISSAGIQQREVLVPASQNEKETVSKDVYQEIDYFEFENHFRGSRADIKQRQSMYLPYFEGKSNVLDLGCGRGEFLEILKENGIKAIGVDLYEKYVDFCKFQGLNVKHDDAIRFLETVENESIGGIFSAQLIEHLQYDQILQLCHLAYMKLENGGCLILETPNPMTLSTYLNSFYIDPSHNKPIHPKTLEYFLKKEGFSKVEILFTDCSKSGYRLPLLSCSGSQNLEEFNDGINLLSDILFGSENFTTVAWK